MACCTARVRRNTRKTEPGPAGIAYDHPMRIPPPSLPELCMKTLFPVFIVLLLAGCATQEFRNAEAYCRPPAYQQYPVVYQQRWETRTRPVEVFTGRTRCVNRDIGNGRT